MNTVNSVRLELLTRDNYDTWKIQMRAVLVRLGLWGFASGAIPKPEEIQGPDGTVRNTAEIAAWKDQDDRALAEIILSISPSELGQVMHCSSSSETWAKLREIYESGEPARRVSLLKQLAFGKMKEGEDIRNHTRKFTEVVDKLGAMDIVIHPDLLSVFLLYSLPPSFETFRVAIESRDELPALDQLRIKIIEESDARGGNTESVPDDLAISKKGRGKGKREKDTKDKFRCFRCKTLTFL